MKTLTPFRKLTLHYDGEPVYAVALARHHALTALLAVLCVYGWMPDETPAERSYVALSAFPVTIPPPPPTPVYEPHVKAFIKRFQETAISEMEIYGIPASIKMAQAMLESGYGRDRLAVEANAYFGIKSGSMWSGQTIAHYDDDYKDGKLVPSKFRAYPTAWASWRAHSEFLQSGERYWDLFTLDTEDYESWAKGLYDAGYASNPKYPDLLIGLIERYGLTALDYGAKVIE